VKRGRGEEQSRAGARRSQVRITVATRRPYEVVVGPGTLAELESALPRGAPAAVVCDATVERLHAARLAGCGALPRLSVPPGEGSKSLAMLERVLEFLLEAGLDRRSSLVAFGGGVVGDLGGLAAALFMRGIPYVQCPTTMLAQVDSSVGGKTAVNLPGGKNLAGAFHQPERVLADTATLATLPDEELRSGLGEVVKSALIGDGALLELLEREAAAILARDEDRLAEVVARCVRVKAAIVARDEDERGERKALNLGHTFAHAIEHAAGFGRIPHGVAVAAGLVLALRASERAGVLVERELVGRITTLLDSLAMPGDLEGLRSRYGVRLGRDELLHGMRHDKKGRAGKPALVLVRGIGAAAWDQDVEPSLVASLLPG
jgi:3-dehydroquinate synthase